jgi:hypothetical protein
MQLHLRRFVRLHVQRGQVLLRGRQMHMLRQGMLLAVGQRQDELLLKRLGRSLELAGARFPATRR